MDPSHVPRIGGTGANSKLLKKSNAPVDRKGEGYVPSKREPRAQKGSGKPEKKAQERKKPSRFMQEVIRLNFVDIARRYSAINKQIVLKMLL
mmetsp:Transcript_3578/g.6075  ORF Transcript_3578/g.6075 Transcript_3578/m.6075 type:complete len:92 (-) Transcript_3578:45-320(-)